VPAGAGRYAKNHSSHPAVVWLGRRLKGDGVT
jgi:hypothetical protein